MTTRSMIVRDARSNVQRAYLAAAGLLLGAVSFEWWLLGVLA